MTGLDIFAILILFVLAITVAAIWVTLCVLPGQIASKRNHPQAEAVRACGWLGGLTLGLLWPVAFIWALVRAPQAPIPAEDIGQAGAQPLATLAEKVSALEIRLSTIEHQGGGAS